VAPIDAALVVTRAGSVRAVWQGVRIQSVADLSQSAEYAEDSPEERLRRAMTDDVGYLHGHLLAGRSPVWQDAALELRLVSRPDQRRIEAAVLGRVLVPDEESFTDTTRRHLERLSALPAHVSGEPITDQNELMALLQPFTADPAGCIELRKRHLIGVPQRPDAGVRYYFAVQPLRPQPGSWVQVFEALLGRADPVMISIGLAPVRLSASFSAALDGIATQFARLSETTSITLGPLSGTEVMLTPDTFAVHAHQLFADAARRYRDVGFRLRVSIASPRPLDDGLAHLLGRLLAPGRDVDSASYLDREAVGSGYVVVRPEVDDDVAAFRANLATLGHDRWGMRGLWESPDRPPTLLRDVSELVDAGEASAAFRLPAAAAGHLTGMVVRHPGVRSEVQWRDDERSVTFGRQVVGGALGGPVGIGVGDLTRHALLAGTTGSGKTNTSLHLLDQLWRRHRVPFLVVEPVNSTLDDYRWLATLPGFEDLIVLTVGNERVAPLRLNPFQVPAGVTVGTHAASLLGCFDAAFGLWDPLPAIYQKALRTTYASLGWALHDVAEGVDGEDWPTLDHFVDAMRSVTDRLDYAGETRSNILAASRLRVESLREGMCSSTLACRSSFPMDTVLRRPVIVELALVGDNQKEQALVTALLLQMMTEYYKAQRAGEGLFHVTVVEEAHRLLGTPPPTTSSTEGDARSRAAEAFANTLAENRKYGEGLVIVEQDPSKLIPDAVKNTGCKIMHRLPSVDDRTVLAGAMGLSPDQESYAARLEPMTALAHHDRLVHAALVRVPDVRAEAAAAVGLSRAPLADDPELRRRFVAFLDAEPRADEALAPFAECAGCGSRCLFRSRGEALAEGDLTDAVRSHLATWPEQATGGAKDVWWTTVHRLVGGAVATGSRRMPAMGVEDLDACAFLHVMRTLYETDIAPWVTRFRTTRVTEDRVAPTRPPILDGP
jgi:hypothetical protein